MDSKKFIAVLAVLIMASSATAVIVCAGTGSEAATLKDQGTVTLDVDKDYSGNAKELSKLGLGEKSWVKVDDGYKLVLKDTVYETKEPTALKVTSANNKVLYVECNGENRFVSNGIDSKGNNICIDAGKSTVGICFVGNGEITVATNNTGATQSIAIYAYKLCVRGCTLTAISSSIEVTTAQNTDYLSYAICMMDKGTVEIDDEAKVYAYADSIKSTDPSTTYANYVSCGLSSREADDKLSFVLRDSILVAVGGDVNAQFSNMAISWGATIGGTITIDDSLLYCGAGDVTLGTTGSGVSEALFFKNDFTVKDSLIVATAGNIQVDDISIGNVGIFSAGVQCNVTGTAMTIEDSAFFSYGGKANVNKFKESNYHFSAGMIFQIHDPFTVTLKGSILESEGGNGSDYSYGFVMMNTSFQVSDNGTLSISDSEFYSTGSNSAMAVKNVNCDKTPKWCGYMKDGTWAEPAGKDPSLIPQDATIVSIGYKYYVYLQSSDEEFAECSVERIDGDTYLLPECPFDAPEGKKFKCWSYDGDEYDAGETIKVQYYAVVTAVWEDVPEPVPPTPASSDYGGVAIIGAIIVTIIALLFCYLIFSRND